MCYADHTITLTTDERADHIILPIFFIYVGYSVAELFSLEEESNGCHQVPLHFMSQSLYVSNVLTRIIATYSQTVFAGY